MFGLKPKRKFNYEHYMKNAGVLAVENAMLPKELQDVLAPAIAANQAAAQAAAQAAFAAANAQNNNNNYATVADSAATFDISVTRNTANLAFDLPAPIFGPIDRQSSYKAVLAQYLPAGCVVSISESPSGNGLRFTYTIGGSSDTIDVECAERSYLSFLESLKGTVIKLSETTLNLGTAANTLQFTKPMRFVVISLFGKSTFDSLTPNQFKKINQLINDMRLINITQEFDQESTLVMTMAQFATHNVTMTSFVEFFNVRNRKAV